MKIDKVTLILIAIIILMSIGLTYMFMSGSDHEIMIQDKQLQQRVDSLTTEIKKVQSERQLLDNNIISLNDSLHVLQDNILVKEAEIEKLKNDYAETIDSINNFTSNDVTKYFTNRYE
tara:strand:+ start:174 stop:527 length:354 start_codon:yes stop_codon:yes gene_type:complete